MSAYVYKVSWYDSPRCTVSLTDQYYFEPHHTRWGQFDQLLRVWGCDELDCRITLITVGINSDEYAMAVKNSQISQKRIDAATDKIKIASLQAIQPLCPEFNVSSWQRYKKQVQSTILGYFFRVYIK